MVADQGGLSRGGLLYLVSVSVFLNMASMCSITGVYVHVTVYVRRYIVCLCVYDMYIHVRICIQFEMDLTGFS